MDTNSNPLPLPPLSFINSEEKFRLLMESVEEYVIFFTDSKGYITDWNAGAERILGYYQKQILGQPIRILFTPEDREQGAPETEMRLALTEGSTINEGWHLRKDGSRFWGSGFLTALRDEEGKVQGFCKIMRDLTLQRRREEELEKLVAAYSSQSRLSTTLQHSLLLTPPLHAFPPLALAMHYEAALAEAEMVGDFFDAFSFWDDRVALVVGDVAGKGLGAALYTTQVKYALRAFLHEHQGDPAPALVNLNAFLIALRNGIYGNAALEMQADGQEVPVPFSNALVSLAVLVLNTKTGRGACSLAGAETPLILRARTNAFDSGNAHDYIQAEEVMSLGSGGPLLGVASDAKYSTSEFFVQRGDLILITTDGITEARRSCNGEVNTAGIRDHIEFFGLDGAANAIRHYARTTNDPGLLDMEALCHTVADMAKEFAHGTISDDVCFVLARYF